MPWLGHCISTADANDIIRSIEIVYEVSSSDHIPFVITLDCHSLPELNQQVKNTSNHKIDWSKLTHENRLSCYGSTGVLLRNLSLPKEAVQCADVNGSLSSHCEDLCTLYECVVGYLYDVSTPYCISSERRYNIKPGWNKHVSLCHAVARSALRAWIQAGRPREGPVLDLKKRTAKYRYAIRYVNKYEQEMRADSMDEKLLDNDVTGFSKEVKSLNRDKTLLPCTIKGVSGGDKITELWRQQYSVLFNCVKSDPYIIKNISSSDKVQITTQEVSHAI